MVFWAIIKGKRLDRMERGGCGGVCIPTVLGNEKVMLLSRGGCPGMGTIATKGRESRMLEVVNEIETETAFTTFFSHKKRGDLEFELHSWE